VVDAVILGDAAIDADCPAALDMGFETPAEPEPALPQPAATATARSPPTRRFETRI
jgi:hypothetical protein